MTRWIHQLCGVLALLGLCIGPLWGQDTGKLEGFISGKSGGEPLVGANVQIVNTELGAATDEDGYYSISGVPAGEYQIEVSFVGYQSTVQPVTVTAGKTVRFDIVLTSQPLKLSEVRVLAIRERADSPVSSNIVTPEEIEESRHASAYDLFRNTAGVYVMSARSIGFGLASRPAGRILIRGLGRRSGGELTIRGIQILVDGIPDFSQTHGHPFPDVHAVDNIERIEVIKGPSSVRHGNAMAGAIIMTTKTPDLGTSYLLKGSGGSFGTTENVARLGYGAAEGYAQVSANFRHTDGHRAEPDKLTAYNGSVKLGYNLAPNFQVDANGMWGHFEWENPGPGGERGGETDWIMGNTDFTYGFMRHNASLKVWGVDGKAMFASGLQEPVTSFGTKAKVDLRYAEKSQVTLGIDWMNYDIARNEVSQGAFNEIGPYVFVHHAFSPRVLGEAGVRYTHNEQFGNEISPEIGLLYRPTIRTGLRARAAHGFRTPNAFETTFGSNANPDLDAAEMWQYEVGFNQIIADRVTVDIVGFLQEGNNLIRSEPDPNAPGGSRLANTGQFSHRGIETALSIHATNELAINLTTTNLDLEDDTALAPHNIYSFGIAFTPGKWTVNVDGRWITELYNRDNKQDKLNDFVVVDAQVSYRINSAVRLFVAADNLFDEEYELVKNFPMPGLGVYGGFSLSR